MAAETTKDLPANTFTLLTASAVSALRVQNVGNSIILLKATTANSAPASADGAVWLSPADFPGVTTDQPLATLFPGVIVSTGYLWALPVNGETGKASVSHA